MCLELIFLLFYSLMLNSQKVIFFSIEQPPILEISAGEDIALNAFQNKRLNGMVSGGTGNYIFKWTPEDKVSYPNILDPEIINLDTSIIFTLEISDGYCIKTDQVLVDFLSSVNELDKKHIFQLRPNPANAEFTIITTKPIQQLNISDLSGRLLQSYYQPENNKIYQIDQYIQSSYIICVIFIDQTIKRMQKYNFHACLTFQSPFQTAKRNA